MVGIIGGGAAGIMAAITAAKMGEKVVIFEKNEKTCKKVYITGKGRCNLTNVAEGERFFANVISNPRFMMSSNNAFSCVDVMNFFRDECNVPLKVEHGGRVFPVSDKSADITDALRGALAKYKVKVYLNFSVEKIERDEKGRFEVIGPKKVTVDKLIIATGGITYPLTGSTGDGYKFAKDFGHSIINPVAGLIGIKCNSPSDLAGLSLKNVKVSACLGEKKLFEEFGEMLFTHTGVSGPCVLTLSSKINRKNLPELSIKIDLKPALEESVLDARLLREFSTNPNKSIVNVMFALMPKSLASVVVEKAEIPLEKVVNSITKTERQRLVKTMKNLTFSIKGLEDIKGAIITAGGVSVKEVNPKTMESRIIKNLYFAGEVLDVDALTGGFNLQIAFSTGYVAGLSASEGGNYV